MADQIRILGIMIQDRKNAATKVQGILTEFGCSIKTRLGLHEAGENVCAPHGLVLLELTGEPSEMDKLEKALDAVEGIKLQKMVF